MIIERNNCTAKYFKEIKQGEVFKYESELYLKTNEINYAEEYNNCVRLKDGEMYFRFDNDIVYEVKCHLVIH